MANPYSDSAQVQSDVQKLEQDPQSLAIKDFAQIMNNPESNAVIQALRANPQDAPLLSSLEQAFPKAHIGDGPAPSVSVCNHCIHSGTGA